MRRGGDGASLELPFTEIVTICAAADLAEGRAVRFEIPRAGRWPLPCFAVRKAGHVRAFVNRCAHWPVTLDMETGDFFDYDETHLQCRTHGALYDLEGRCFAGPCTGDRLTPLPVEERGGSLVLDLTRLSPAVLAL